MPRGMDPLSERIARRALIVTDAAARNRLTALAFTIRAQGDRLHWTGPEIRHR